MKFAFRQMKYLLRKNETFATQTQKGTVNYDSPFRYFLTKINFEFLILPRLLGEVAPKVTERSFFRNVVVMNGGRGNWAVE